MSWYADTSWIQVFTPSCRDRKRSASQVPFFQARAAYENGILIITYSLPRYLGVDCTLEAERSGTLRVFSLVISYPWVLIKKNIWRK